MDINLSKSRYCRGLQCPKMLWLEQHKPEMAVNTAPESILANGNMVGDYARRYFGEYSLVEYNTDKTVMAEQTAELMAKGAQNIAEASFCTDGLYCAVDILHRNGHYPLRFDHSSGERTESICGNQHHAAERHTEGVQHQARRLRDQADGHEHRRIRNGELSPDRHGRKREHTHQALRWRHLDILSGQTLR